MTDPLANIPSLSTIVGYLVIVCVVAYFSLRFFYGRGGALRRLGVSRRFIRILDQQPLAQNRSLMIIEVGGKGHLLGVTDQTISYLSPIDMETLPKDSSDGGKTDNNFTPFNSYLGALSRRWKRNKDV